MLLHGPDDEESAVALVFANKKPAERFHVPRALRRNRAECYLTLIKMMANVYSAIDSISTSARINMF